MYHSPIVNAAMLAVSTPEAVCAFLKERCEALTEHSQAIDDSWLPDAPIPRVRYDLPDEYERTLLARQDRLIDLHLALYGFDEDVVSELFFRDEQDKAMRCAALSNEARAQPEFIFGFFLERDERLFHFLKNATWHEIRSLFSNGKISFSFMEKIFSRQGIFAELDTKVMSEAVSALTLNTQIFQRGFDNPEYVAEFFGTLKALWEFSRDMPASPLWAFHLGRLYANLRFDYTNIEDVLIHAQRWKAPDEEGRKQEASDNRRGDLSNWQLVRFHLGRLAVRHRQVTREELLENNDLALRLAAYASMPATLANINSAFDKDGAPTFEAFFKNRQLWQSASNRYRLSDLAKIADQQAENYHIGDISSFVYRFIAALRLENPDWFIEENIDHEEGKAAIGERDAAGDAKSEHRQKLDELAEGLRQVSRRVAVLIGLVAFLVLRYFLG